MSEPAYVSIAGEYARQIRTGDLRPGTQLPSYAEMAERHGVSQIVIRKAVALLASQGLVRSAPRRGTFVADRPNLVRVSPERQMESPETTFGNESGNAAVATERDTGAVSATEDLADVFDVVPGSALTHTVTRAAENGRPVSISDTYQPVGAADVGTAAAVLEETIADRLPTPEHAAWLRTAPGDLVKTVHQRFLDSSGRVLMVSDVSYPRDRYDAFVFRMTLEPGTAE